MKFDRLTKAELTEYCENIGLTALQKDILRLKYFDERDLSVVQICFELHISESKFYRNQRKLLTLIYKYDKMKI